MLIVDSAFRVPEVPGILVFRDDAAETSFYAVAAAPRIAMDPDDSPQISLILYGKRVSGVFEPAGGVLTLTLSVGLTGAEQDTLLSALTKLLAPPPPADPEHQPPTPDQPRTPTFLGMYWSSAKVVLKGPAGILASTNASLFGDNRASFSLRLTSVQAKAADAGLRLDAQYETILGKSGIPLMFEGPIDLAAPEFREKTSRTEL